MTLAEGYDSRPLRVRIIEALQKFPDGVTCKELAQQLGDWQPTISAIVSKIHTYGGPVEKLKIQKIGPHGTATKWRLKR